MPLIPPKRMEPRETLSLRVDRGVHERLQQYAAFVRSPKDYVVAQALERLFRGDRDFARWLQARGSGVPAGEADASHAGGDAASVDAAAVEVSTDGRPGGRSRTHRSREG